MKRIIYTGIAIICMTDVAFGAATCSEGYTKLNNINPSTFAPATNGICQFGGYTFRTIPDDFQAIFNGFTMGGAVTLCQEGYFASGKTCTAFVQGSCENTAYNLAVNSASFAAPVNNICQIGGYSLKTIPEELTPIYNGYVMGSAIKLCDNGHLSGGSCVSYASGDCIENYYDLAINANTMAELTNGTCSNPYRAYTGTTRCDRNPGSTCVNVPTPQITINWNDGTGAETSSTCYYEESIVLPETPSRAGYIFNGWKVTQTNN